MLAIPKPQCGTPEERDVAKLKTDFYRAGVSWGTPEAADSYRWTKHATDLVATEFKKKKKNSSVRA